MDVQNKARTVRVLVSRELRIDLDRVTPESKLADLGADNLAIVSLVLDVEDELGVCPTDDDIAGITTVGELIAMAEQPTAALAA